ncbi:hypothetical protein B296_00045596 [Ensete ventricosum]|uniref:Uncharacterized protein n=1 Tax=Ensete ventricosum TaxID=4639 RepID=A0A426Z6W7_ENSVE|nr:hypothetical protein B296_00045596 [Ensete ventricosum]
MTFWTEGRLARLHYVPIEMAAMHEVLDLVLQIISLLGIVPVVTVEATIMSAISVLSSRPHRVGNFEESPLSDLEKDLRPSGVERDIGQSRNGLVASLYPPPLEPMGRGGSLHKRPEEVGRPNLDHESLNVQRWVRIGNDPNFVCETGEVLAEVFLLFLPHPEEGYDGWLWSCAREKVGIKLPCELIERVNGGGWQPVVPSSGDPLKSRRESPTCYGV